MPTTTLRLILAGLALACAACGHQHHHDDPPPQQQPQPDFAPYEPPVVAPTAPA